MRRTVQKVLTLCLTLCCAALAQEGPRAVNISDLTHNPLKFDGRLVSVRAWLELGWEGDNFLVDRSEPSHGTAAQRRVWVYCDAEHDRQVCGQTYHPGSPAVQVTFVGYFHFAPNKKVRMKSEFDPGAFQLQATGFRIGPR